MKEIQNNEGRLSAFALAEIAFLISLTSADSEVSFLAAKGLRLLAHSESQLGAPTNPIVGGEDRAKRHLVYEQLGDPRVMIVGAYSHVNCLPHGCSVRRYLRTRWSPKTHAEAHQTDIISFCCPHSSLAGMLLAMAVTVRVHRGQFTRSI